MSDPFDSDELWFAHLLASVPTPPSLERPAAAAKAEPATAEPATAEAVAAATAMAAPAIAAPAMAAPAMAAPAAFAVAATVEPATAAPAPAVPAPAVPATVEPAVVAPTTAAPAGAVHHAGGRRRYRTLAMAGGLALLVGVLGGLGLGLTRAGDNKPGVPGTGGGAPAARVQPGLAGDDVHQDVVMFGGRGPGGALLADTWVWDGKAWSERHPLHSPTPRRAMAMSSDPADGGVLLLGGIGSRGETLADTWAWDGTDWRQIDPGAPPGPRAGAMLVQDPVYGHVVLFGGQHLNGGHGSTWSWNGASWNQEHPVDSPPDCDGSSMAFDDAFRRVVMVTGRGCTTPASAGTTWAWDGHDWTELRPTASPPPGSGATLAYDDSTQMLVLAVPEARGCALVTWTWDTNDWSLRPSAGSPLGPAVVVRDAASRRPLMVSASGESWLWNGSAWTVVAGSPLPAGACPTP